MTTSLTLALRTSPHFKPAPVTYRSCVNINQVKNRSSSELGDSCQTGGDGVNYAGRSGLVEKGRLSSFSKVCLGETMNLPAELGQSFQDPFCQSTVLNLNCESFDVDAEHVPFAAMMLRIESNEIH